MSQPASDERGAEPLRTGGSQRLHPDVLKLGLVSFLTDLSSEMNFSVFAVFFTTVAGTSSSLLGLIEGLADFSASSLNYWAGWLSDRSGRRKWLATAGYGISALAKLILLASSSVVGLSIFRVIERLGKGFRGPPARCVSVVHRRQGVARLCLWHSQGTRQVRRCARAAGGLCAAVQAWRIGQHLQTPVSACLCPGRARRVGAHAGGRPSCRPARARKHAGELKEVQIASMLAHDRLKVEAACCVRPCIPAWGEL